VVIWDHGEERRAKSLALLNDKGPLLGQAKGGYRGTKPRLLAHLLEKKSRRIGEEASFYKRGRYIPTKTNRAN